MAERNRNGTRFTTNCTSYYESLTYRLCCGDSNELLVAGGYHTSAFIDTVILEKMIQLKSIAYLAVLMGVEGQLAIESLGSLEHYK